MNAKPKIRAVFLLPVLIQCGTRYTEGRVSVRNKTSGNGIVGRLHIGSEDLHQTKSARKDRRTPKASPFSSACVRARASWSAAVRSAAFGLKCCDLPSQRDVTQTKASVRSVWTILLVTGGVLAGLGAESAKEVDDSTRQVTPASFNGSKAGDQREIAGIKLCWC